MHLAALGQMGADIKVKHGVVYAAAPDGLRGAAIDLRFPSVGQPIRSLWPQHWPRVLRSFRGQREEPEVVALADMINAMGGMVEGAGDLAHCHSWS